MNAAITVILALVTDLIPVLGVSGATETAVAAIVKALTALLPLVVDEVETVIPMVKQVIADAQNTGALTPDQVTALNAVSVQYDAAFEAVVAGYQKNHPATDATS